MFQVICLLGGRNCNRPYGSRAAQPKSVPKNTNRQAHLRRQTTLDRLLEQRGAVAAIRCLISLLGLQSFHSRGLVSFGKKNAETQPSGLRLESARSVLSLL